MYSASRVYLSDSGALEDLVAVHPSCLTTWACTIVLSRNYCARVRVPWQKGDAQIHIWKIGGVKGPVLHPRTPTMVGWRGACEDARHHVECEKDLRQTYPHIQKLLVSPKATDCGQQLIEMHCRPWKNKSRGKRAFTPPSKYSDQV